MRLPRGSTEWVSWDARNADKVPQELRGHFSIMLAVLASTDKGGETDTLFPGFFSFAFASKAVYCRCVDVTACAVQRMI